MQKILFHLHISSRFYHFKRKKEKRKKKSILVLGVVVLQQMLQQLHSFLGLNLVDFKKILKIKLYRSLIVNKKWKRHCPIQGTCARKRHRQLAGRHCRSPSPSAAARRCPKDRGRITFQGHSGSLKPNRFYSSNFVLFNSRIAIILKPWVLFLLLFISKQVSHTDIRHSSITSCF